MVKVKRFERPVDPPSIFPHCSQSMTPQTFPGSYVLKMKCIGPIVVVFIDYVIYFPAKRRRINERNISLEKRGSHFDEIDTFNAKDKLPEWDEFCASLPFTNSVKELQLVVQVMSSSNIILKINETTVEYSVVVDQNFSVCAKKRNTVVGIRDLLGFQQKLERYSQLDAVLHRVKNAVCCLESEVRVAIDDLRSISETSDKPLD
ncbi:MAG: hypothetical protein AAGK05_18140, partial [Pseudomonadota bacterium]